jgi:hypothetical protein
MANLMELSWHSLGGIQIAHKQFQSRQPASRLGFTLVTSKMSLKIY